MLNYLYYYLNTCKSFIRSSGFKLLVSQGKPDHSSADICSGPRVLEQDLNIPLMTELLILTVNTSIRCPSVPPTARLLSTICHTVMSVIAASLYTAVKAAGCVCMCVCDDDDDDDAMGRSSSSEQTGPGLRQQQQ